MVCPLKKPRFGNSVGSGSAIVRRSSVGERFDSSQEYRGSAEHVGFGQIEQSAKISRDNV